MKKILPFILLSIVSFGQKIYANGDYTGLKYAVFHIQESSEGLAFTAQMDRQIVSEVLKGDFSAENISAYFNEHVTVAFDSDSLILQYQEHRFSAEFIELKFQVNAQHKDAQTFYVWSNMLLAEVVGQENVFRIELGDQKQAIRTNELTQSFTLALPKPNKKQGRR